MVHALRSRRVITPHGERDAAVLIDAEIIVAIKPLSELSSSTPVEDLGNLALLLTLLFFLSFPKGICFLLLLLLLPLPSHSPLLLPLPSPLP